MTVQDLRIADIRRDGGTQMRAQLDLATIADYATAMQEGAQFPPVVTFYDGSDYWLADGFQRADAARHIERETISADVRAGTRRDAILYAVGANANHGLRRSNNDKRRAVETLLRDGEWASWSNREVARRCAVDEGTVRRLREELSAEVPQIERKATRNGTGYTINTANIGRRAEPEPAPAYEPVATWDTMPVGEPDEDEPEDELDARMARIMAQADKDMQYDAPEPLPWRPSPMPSPPTTQPDADMVSMTDVARLQAEGEAKSPHTAALPFISTLKKLSEVVVFVKASDTEAWLDVADPAAIESATRTLASIQEWAQRAEQAIAARKRAGFRIVSGGK